MKILFVNNGITHYYNGVLNRLHTLPGAELVLAIPRKAKGTLGDAVFESRDGVKFRIIELEERVWAGGFPALRGLTTTIVRERPDIIVIADVYAIAYALNAAAVIAQKAVGAKLIMKSIPFRLPTPDEERGRDPWPKRALKLALRKHAFNFADAHVNYIPDAVRVYGSYGVPAERIFVTGNSPDTDAILAIRDQLTSAARSFRRTLRA